MDQSEDQTYELKIRILGNEIFAIALATTSTSSRWITVALISIFSTLVLLGAYGEKLIELYRWLTA
jgi:predicted DNA repair protein MutK